MPLTFWGKGWSSIFHCLFKIKRVKRIKQAAVSLCEILESCSYVWLDWKCLEGSDCLTLWIFYLVPGKDPGTVQAFSEYLLN